MGAGGPPKVEPRSSVKPGQVIKTPVRPQEGKTPLPGTNPVPPASEKKSPATGQNGTVVERTLKEARVIFEFDIKMAYERVRPFYENHPQAFHEAYSHLRSGSPLDALTFYKRVHLGLEILAQHDPKLTGTDLALRVGELLQQTLPQLSSREIIVLYKAGELSLKPEVPRPFFTALCSLLSEAFRPAETRFSEVVTILSEENNLECFAEALRYVLRAYEAQLERIERTAEEERINRARAAKKAAEHREEEQELERKEEARRVTKKFEARVAEAKTRIILTVEGSKAKEIAFLPLEKNEIDKPLLVKVLVEAGKIAEAPLVELARVEKPAARKEEAGAVRVEVVDPQVRKAAEKFIIESTAAVIRTGPLPAVLASHHEELKTVIREVVVKEAEKAPEIPSPTLVHEETALPLTDFIEAVINGIDQFYMADHPRVRTVLEGETKVLDGLKEKVPEQRVRYFTSFFRWGRLVERLGALPPAARIDLAAYLSKYVFGDRLEDLQLLDKPQALEHFGIGHSHLFGDAREKKFFQFISAERQKQTVLERHGIKHPDPIETIIAAGKFSSDLRKAVEEKKVPEVSRAFLGVVDVVDENFPQGAIAPPRSFLDKQRKRLLIETLSAADVPAIPVILGACEKALSDLTALRQQSQRPAAPVEQLKEIAEEAILRIAQPAAPEKPITAVATPQAVPTTPQPQERPKARTSTAEVAIEAQISPSEIAIPILIDSLMKKVEAAVVEKRVINPKEEIEGRVVLRLKKEAVSHLLEACRKLRPPQSIIGKAAAILKPGRTKVNREKVEVLKSLIFESVYNLDAHPTQPPAPEKAVAAQTAPQPVLVTPQPQEGPRVRTSTVEVAVETQISPYEVAIPILIDSLMNKVEAAAVEKRAIDPKEEIEGRVVLKLKKETVFHLLEACRKLRPPQSIKERISTIFRPGRTKVNQEKVKVLESLIFESVYSLDTHPIIIEHLKLHPQEIANLNQAVVDVLYNHYLASVSDSPEEIESRPDETLHAPERLMVAVKQIARENPAPPETTEVVNSYRRNVLTLAVRVLSLEDRGREVRKELRQVQAAAAAANLKISLLNTLVGYVYAGMVEKVVLRNDQELLSAIVGTPEALKSTANLRRVLEILEGEIYTAVGKDYKEMSRATIAAEVYLYGIIMRRVDARRTRAAKIIEALRKERGTWDALVSLMRNRDLEEVTRFLDTLILEAKKEAGIIPDPSKPLREVRSPYADDVLERAVAAMPKLRAS